jgi:hypothetical protein
VPQFKRERFQRMAQDRMLFRGRESFRLMSMLFMLALIGMLIFQSKNPSMWTWLAPGLESKPTTEVAEKPSATEPILWTETIVPGLADDDSEETEAAKEEFQAIADRQPLDIAEMPSYWRLMRWIRSVSFDEAAQRARRDILFTHLWDTPGRHRGELIFLKLHLARAIAHEPETSPNSAGVGQVYEAWGTTTESGVHLYCVAFPEVPAGLELGDSIHEEADFVGYFLKNLPYHDRLDKYRAAPLLIGRLRWRENPVRVAIKNQSDDLFLPTIAVGVLVACVVFGSWRYTRRSSSHLNDATQISSSDHQAIETWIEHADGPVDSPESPPTGSDRRSSSNPDWTDVTS